MCRLSTPGAFRLSVARASHKQAQSVPPPPPSRCRRYRVTRANVNYQRPPLLCYRASRDPSSSRRRLSNPQICHSSRRSGADGVCPRVGYTIPSGRPPPGGGGRLGRLVGAEGAARRRRWPAARGRGGSAVNTGRPRLRPRGIERVTGVRRPSGSVGRAAGYVGCRTRGEHGRHSVLPAAPPLHDRAPHGEAMQKKHGQPAGEWICSRFVVVL